MCLTALTMIIKALLFVLPSVIFAFKYAMRKDHANHEEQGKMSREIPFCSKAVGSLNMVSKNIKKTHITH